MIDFIMMGLAASSAASAYLRKSVIGGAILALYAGLFFNTQYNLSFVDWLNNHGVAGNGSFLSFLVSMAFVLVPVFVTLFSYKSGRGHLILRLLSSIALGLVAGFYIGTIISTTKSFNNLPAGPLYTFVSGFITPLGVVAMALAVVDIYISRPKKSKHSDEESKK